MKDFIKLIRPHHYIKNFLIFLPLVFSGNLFKISLFLENIRVFAAFCMVASAVYIINDYCDIEADKKHPKKKNRPLASGRVSKKQAIILLAILLGFSVVLAYSLKPILIIIVYLFLNVIYSLKLKHVAIFDISILASGFVLRVILGGIASGVIVSNWLYLTIMAFSFYMAVGKRRGELRKNGSKSRKVLKQYNLEFLDSSLNIFVTLTLTFYSLWAATTNNKYLLFSIPIVIMIVLKYSLEINKPDSMGDPIDVFFDHKELLLLGFVYAIFILFALYGVK